MNLGSGAYAMLQEAKSRTPFNITIRDAIMDYVKAETAAGRKSVHSSTVVTCKLVPDPKGTRGTR